MSTIAFGTALIALGFAYVSHRRALTARRETELAAQKFASLRLSLLREMEAVRESVPRTVQLELKKVRGELRFTGDMTIAEAISIDSRVKDVMAQFHIGGCSSCSVSDRETLLEGARGHGVDPDHLLEALNAMLEGRPIHTPPLQPMQPQPVQSQPMSIGGVLSN